VGFGLSHFETGSSSVYATTGRMEREIVEAGIESPTINHRAEFDSSQAALKQTLQDNTGGGGGKGRNSQF
jgi:hypothetical protein